MGKWGARFEQEWKVEMRMASLGSVIRQGKQTRSDLRQLRKPGRVPTVIYGYGTKNVSVKTDEVEFIKIIREVSRNGVIELGVSSETIKIMVANYQFDPLENQITHIDFLTINMSEERTVEVPVQLVGKAIGAREGGIIEQLLFNLEVTVTPDNIPEAVEVDIAELNISDSLTVADTKVTGDFKIENDSAESVVTVVAPTEEPTEEEIEAMEGEQQTEEPGAIGENRENKEKTGE